MSESFSSIYQKCCPQCMASNAQDAARCACGYHFHADQAPLMQVLEDEKLYEAYLAARADQAKAAFASAQKAYEADPANDAKKAHANQAREARDSAEAELSRQRGRTQALVRITRMTVAESKSPATQPAATPTGVFVHPVPKLIRRANPQAEAVVQAAKVLKAELKELRVHGGRAPHPAATRQLNSELCVPAPQTSAEAGARRAAASQCSVCGGAPTPDSACDCARTKAGMSPEMATRFPSLYEAYMSESAPAKSAAEAAGPDKVSPAAKTLVAPQPAAAPVIVKTKPAAPATPVAGAPMAKPAVPAAPVAPSLVTPVPGARAEVSNERQDAGATAGGRAQPAREAKAVPARAEAGKAGFGKECPHCTAVLPAETKTCKCGMNFPDNGQATVMPGLSLGPGEVIRLEDLYRR